MYRPNDWKNPHHMVQMTYDEQQVDLAYEAGADAMLEALKAKGVEARHVRSVGCYFLADGYNATYRLSHKTPDNTDGWLVFIPEGDSDER